jgi:MinD superfamily P-loop ATPase
MKAKPIIDESKCDGCGLCITVCACGALKIVGKSVKAVSVANCGWCTMCELVCPEGAITCPFEIVFENDQK